MVPGGGPLFGKLPDLRALQQKGGVRAGAADGERDKAGLEDVEVMQL